MTHLSSRRARLAVLALGGLAAGFLNGLLGAGGGILLVFVMGLAMGEELDGKDIFANALCVMLPISLLSVATYALGGRLTADGIDALLLPAMVGGAAGALLLDRIAVASARRLFALLVVFSGIVMLVR